MDWYLLTKTIHIISGTILFGTGLGSAFFLFMANRSDSIETIRVTVRHVVLADWLFTAPTVVIQPITGVILMQQLGLPFDSGWFLWVVALYLLAAACWIPVVWIQYRLQGLANAASSTDRLPDSWRSLFRIWRALGYVAFACILAIFYLMVFKPGI